MEQENIEFRQVRDFGDLINDTFLFIKKNWKPVLQALATICGFFVVASAIASAYHQMQIMEYAASSPEGSGGVFKQKGIFTAEYFVNIFFSYITYFATSLTIYCYIALYLEKGNQAPAVEEVWGYFKYFFFRFIGANILLTLMFFVGFILCLIPGIYLAPIVSIILAVMIFENASLAYSFNRGFVLVKDNWWTTFGAIAVVLLAVYALMMMVVLPMSIITKTGIFLGANTVSTPVLIITSLVEHLSVIFTTLANVVIPLCYFSLVEKKEGASLMDRINTIGKDHSADDLPDEQY